MDHMLGGRLEAGFVPGIVPEFFVPYQADFANRRAITNEFLDLVEVAYANEEPFSFDGRFHQYRNVKLSVLPLQKPYPPLWLDTREPEILAILAEKGVNTAYLIFFPREEAAPRYRAYIQRWRKAGHARRPEIGYWSLVYVDETDGKATEKAARNVVYAGERFFSLDVGVDSHAQQENLARLFEGRNEPGAAEIIRNLRDFDYLMERNLIFVGSPSTVVRAIREAAGEGLFNTLFCEFNIGSLDEADLMRSIRLFGTEVMPQLAGFEPY